MRRQVRRRRLSMTSLIDVIFLLLLFFMLSSTFSRFAEIEIASAAPGPAAGVAEAAPYFVQLAPDRLTVNGAPQDLAGLPEAFSRHAPGSQTAPVLVSLRGDVSAQRLTDLLVALRGIAGLSITVLETT